MDRGDGVRTGAQPGLVSGTEGWSAWEVTGVVTGAGK